MSRAPILGWKGYAPERRSRLGKFQADFCFPGTHRAEEYNVALLLFLGLLVLHGYTAAAREPGLQLNKRSMSIDRQRIGILFEGLPLGIRTANADRDLHQDSLAPSART